MKHFVSEIFAEPEHWGLRGDQFLWRYLKDYYTAIEVPFSIEKLKKDIDSIFKDFTGEFPEHGKQYFVPEFAKIHVGMSTGQLSGNFWLNEAIPMLSKRLKELNAIGR